MVSLTCVCLDKKCEDKSLVVKKKFKKEDSKLTSAKIFSYK